jgi:hypothetical protein
MKILVQDNVLQREGQYPQLKRALSILEIDHQFVNVFAFVDKIFDASVHASEIDETEELTFDTSIKTLTFGSQRLSRLAQERGLYPAAFNSFNFDYSNWSKGFGLDSILNGDTQIVRLKDATIDSEKIFVRPFRDDKSFNGMAMDRETFLEWKEGICSQPIEGTSIFAVNSETYITLASVKQIYSEYRFFVINEEVVTGSQYRLGRTVIYNDNVPEHIREYAQEMANKWQPQLCFVIDIADTPLGPKVVEINSFGVSGFYHCNMFKVIEKLLENKHLF